MISTPLSQSLDLELPLICGPMYPCSNKELVAAVSKAGGLGVVQPLSMVFVYKDDFREGLKWIRSQTDKAIGMNVLIEKSAKKYEDTMKNWVDIALEEGVRFFITSLGNPKWVVDKVRPHGGLVYHDVTERKWALKALEADVDGLICVNQKAGGHAGHKEARKLMADLKDLGKPLICAGGISTPEDFKAALDMGYAGVQMGTRFIATEECQAHSDYKQAIVEAQASDIVMTDKLSGTPCAIINTPSVQKMGTDASLIEKKLLKNRNTKYMMRTYYALKSVWKLKEASTKGHSYKDFWQAGQSVQGIDEVCSVAELMDEFKAFMAKEQSLPTQEPVSPTPAEK